MFNFWNFCVKFYWKLIIQQLCIPYNKKPKYFGVDGIMYDSNTKYNGLIKTIATQLKIDINYVQIEIRYIVSDKCPLVIIHNDTGVKVHLDQKIIISEFFFKYPLYITYKDIVMNSIECTEQSIVCGQNQSCNKVNVEQKHLYTNDSIYLIGLCSEEEIFD